MPTASTTEVTYSSGGSHNGQRYSMHNPNSKGGSYNHAKRRAEERKRREAKERAGLISSKLAELAKQRTVLIKPGDSANKFFIGNWKCKVRFTKLVVKERSIGNGFILGHPVNSVLGPTAVLGVGTGDASAATTQTIILDQALTDVGRTEIAKKLAAEASSAPTHLAWGTGTTAFTVGDTALGSETSRRALE